MEQTLKSFILVLFLHHPYANAVSHLNTENIIMLYFWSLLKLSRSTDLHYLLLFNFNSIILCSWTFLLIFIQLEDWIFEVRGFWCCFLISWGGGESLSKCLILKTFIFIFSYILIHVPKTCKNFQILCTGKAGFSQSGIKLHYEVPFSIEW